MNYTLTLTPDDDGSFLVTCADLPEVTSFGDNEADAVKHGLDAVQEAIAARMDAFEDIPQPTTDRAREHRAKIPLALELKVQLYWALREAGMSRADFVRATGWPRTKVDRLFDPNHESKLAQIEEAFAILNKSVLVRLEAA